MAKKSKEGLQIAQQLIPPGRQRRIELPVSHLSTGNLIAIPVVAFNGALPGPTVWISAGIHGDELNGIEIVSQVMRRLRPQKMRGAVLCVPVVNVFGYLTQRRYMPDRRDLNRVFPGSARGSMSSRVANLLMEEIVRKCEFGIDLHSGSNNRANMPQVRIGFGDKRSCDLAAKFGAPVVVNARLRDGSLRAVANARGVEVLVYETGETLRFDTEGIRIGVRGTLRVLTELGILESDEDAEPLEEPSWAWESTWVRAEGGGIAHVLVSPGTDVKKGEEVVEIGDIFGRSTTRVKAPFDGLVIGSLVCPLVSRGDALVHLAKVNGSRPHPD
ncbi:succinylglutamate desuccinylase/aspartoacylase family protein [Fimbriimonadia bacterium ATM]|nr:MAG: succinylglutamate desuccinylase/aspartoacylase family protein [Armatimonadota bacterium]MBC6968508.1 deacylase [Armatimonadota bacterium]MCE7898653.1 deacylase [Armatimonadetes bacterium ATM1]MDL1928054.1 succinylglutamate desuccinylase/aspartoacylase family protein [Fimbriimonadia bacterium ATM]RIJ98375.1 MAG: deacylase [Armatimonadota bacterium]